MKGSDNVAEKGWIKLHRQLQECPMWYAERFSKGQAWVDLLLLANHRDKKILFNGEIITIQRGQYLTSMVKLAEKWKWSRPTVVKFLNLLERDRMITRSSDNTKTLITIENYSVYQDISEDDLQPTLQPSCNPIDNPINNPLYTNKNNKNIKNDKNDKNVKNNNRVAKAPDVHYPNDKKLNQAFIDFMEMRKKIKKPMTDRAITLAMNKLKELSTLPFSDAMDNDLAIQILEQSTMNCWQSLYPINKSSGKQANSIDWNNV